MTTKIEQVAQAICFDDADLTCRCQSTDECTLFQPDKGRAAIEAMAIPSEAMISAGSFNCYKWVDAPEGSGASPTPRDCYMSMIRKALEEGDE